MVAVAVLALCLGWVFAAGCVGNGQPSARGTGTSVPTTTMSPSVPVAYLDGYWQGTYAIHGPSSAKSVQYDKGAGTFSMNISRTKSFIVSDQDYEIIYDGEASLDGFQMAYLSNNAWTYTSPFGLTSPVQVIQKKKNGNETVELIPQFVAKPCRKNPKLDNCGIGFPSTLTGSVQDNSLTIPFTYPMEGSLSIRKTR
jgi:hypothetical protein